MPTITVYEKPTCTTCRKLSKIFSEKWIGFEKVNYFIEHFSKSQLKNLLKKMNLKPSELLRKNEHVYKDLDIKNKSYSEDQILDLLIMNPDLVQRPIVEIDNKAILARPAEKVLEIL